MSDENIDTSIHQGELTLFDYTLKFHVLSNGKPVIEADSLEGFVLHLSGGTMQLTNKQAHDIQEKLTSFFSSFKKTSNN